MGTPSHLPAGECVSPPSRGRTHLPADEGVGRGSQFGRGNKHCGTLGIFVLCACDLWVALVPPLPFRNICTLHRGGGGVGGNGQIEFGLSLGKRDNLLTAEGRREWGRSYNCEKARSSINNSILSGPSPNG